MQVWIDGRLTSLTVDKALLDAYMSRGNTLREEARIAHAVKVRLQEQIERDRTGRA